ncbi:uncharacterized protein LOC129922873 [Biomphalaria glabrata]|uniref:Uncharacterized protein LOC129922873 n=1 Tax=Biomphalaria glabrata TaxID=6526 RepID=A0A9W2YVR3_BIOGL|nr:uncharacterized protein LOC129922873 [Biomphalaria glabrata]
MYCKDSGTFICEANNGILFNNKNSKQITVFVRCPLQFTFSEVIRNFTFQEGKTFSYNVTMYGYPEPDKFIIYKSNKETTNIIITKLPLEAPYISVELKIDKITSSDFDHYTLVIFQSGVPSLTFQFTVIEEKETSINVAAVVGGCVAACFVVIIIVAVCYAKRKYEINLTCKKKHLNTSTKEPHNYSELSTVQHQDKHNYETPMSITNLSIPETTTQYINVKEQSQSHSAYEEIDNI